MSDQPESAPPNFDFDHVYLLTSVENGHRRTLSWMDNERPYVKAIVLNADEHGVPLGASNPGSCTLEWLPSTLTHQEAIQAATARGGHYATGWYYAEGFKRTLKDDPIWPVKVPVAVLNKV